MRDPRSPSWTAQEPALCRDLCTRRGGPGRDWGHGALATCAPGYSVEVGRRRDRRPRVTVETGVVWLIAQRPPKCPSGDAGALG
jgi:hypothetical protein